MKIIIGLLVPAGKDLTILYLSLLPFKIFTIFTLKREMQGR